MACWRTPSTSSTPKAFDPTQVSSLKYSGGHHHRSGGFTPLSTSAPRVRSSRTDTFELSTEPMVS
jgi:hypothetical protein